MWRAYIVGCGKHFTTAQVKGLGAPQGPTNLCVVQSFSLPWEEVGALRSTSRKDVSHPQPSMSQSLQEPTTGEATRMYFSCPEKG